MKTPVPRIHHNLWFVPLAVGLLLSLCLVACGNTARRPGGRDGGTVDSSYPGDDGGPRPGYDGGPVFDGGPVDMCNPACGPIEICGPDGNGDGNDDNCNGMVDETCACPHPGETRACFRGPPDRRGIGSCADGIMTCTEFLTWSSCIDGQFPEDEVCDGADNDCNGVADDGLSGCSTAVTCPGTQGATPLNFYALRGETIYTGAARSWQWNVSCPPTVSPCPAPEAATAQDTRIFFTQSGSYRVGLDVVTDTGETVGCEWVVQVQGAGLRVEMLWDTQGSAHGDTDVDLHLHRKSVPMGSATGETEFFTNDDCYFANCKASSYTDGVRAAWGMEDTTDLNACRDAPHGEGADWVSKGACYNPRLDVDVISCTTGDTDPNSASFCAPENINVDNPPLGVPFRIMVNYYSDNSLFGGGGVAETHPQVNIYCGGELRAAFGSDPLVTLRNGSSFGADNDNWMVADVVFFRNECGGLDCLINPLGDILRGPGFGPPWSF